MYTLQPQSPVRWFCLRVLRLLISLWCEVFLLVASPVWTNQSFPPELPTAPQQSGMRHPTSQGYVCHRAPFCSLKFNVRLQAWYLTSRGAAVPVLVVGAQKHSCSHCQRRLHWHLVLWLCLLTSDVLADVLMMEQKGRPADGAELKDTGTAQGCVYTTSSRGSIHSTTAH